VDKKLKERLRIGFECFFVCSLFQGFLGVYGDALGFGAQLPEKQVVAVFKEGKERGMGGCLCVINLSMHVNT